MNKINRYLSVAIAASAICVGCTKSISEYLSVERNVKFNAVTESGTGTKTLIDDDLSALWQSDDEISIFVGSSANMRYSVKSGAGTTSATFTKVVGSEPVEGSTELSTNYAMYPYSESTSIASTGIISFDLPKYQEYQTNSFANGSCPMVAVSASSENINLDFKNLCGIVKLKLNGTAKIRKIVFSGNNGEKLSGAATVQPVYGTAPELNMASSADTLITLTCPDQQLSGDTNTEFWFVVPPTVFSKGFKFTIYDTDGYMMTKGTSSSITVARNKIQPMNAFTYTATENVIENIVFADANFKAALLNLTVDGEDGSAKIDADDDGEISLEEALAVTKIRVTTDNIESLGGIEDFVNLEVLSCNGTCVWNSTTRKYEYNGKLTSLDLSKNTALTRLECIYNQLTALDISKNTALTNLSCSDNQITALDVSNNTALTNLSCTNNQLTSLDVSKNTKLTRLNCYSNQLTTLDVTKNTALTDLLCAYNQLTSLDVSKNTALTWLECVHNQLTSLDVSKNTKLTRLNCYSNQLTTLDVSKNTALTDLSCSPMKVNEKNVLKTLYMAKGQVIKYINLERNGFYIPAETQIVTGKGSNEGVGVDTPVTVSALYAPEATGVQPFEMKSLYASGWDVQERHTYLYIISNDFYANII